MQQTCHVLKKINAGSVILTSKKIITKLTVTKNEEKYNTSCVILTRNEPRV